MFDGFKEETGDFFFELMFNNERPWFQENRERFERDVRIPFTECANITYDRFCEKASGRDWLLHISRIYRDARRLHGRGPYKDHLWFSIKEQDGLLQGPMFWFEIGARDYAYGMGFYSATPAQMAAFRRAIDADPAAFAKMAEEISFTRFKIDAETYKRPKAERGELVNPWYNAKRIGVSYREELGGDVFSPRLPEILAERLFELLPLYDFFMKACKSAGD